MRDLSDIIGGLTEARQVAEWRFNGLGVVLAAKIADAITILTALRDGRQHGRWFILETPSGYTADRPGIDLDERARVFLTRAAAEEWADLFDEEEGQKGALL